MERTEQGIRRELRRILGVQDLVLERLQALAGLLPAQPARRGRNRAGAARLRSAIECLVTDSIRPGIESLRVTLELPDPAAEADATAGGPVRWSQEIVVRKPWPWNLRVPAEVLQLLDLATGDVAALVEEEGWTVLHPHRQWFAALPPPPWGEASLSEIEHLLAKEVAFVLIDQVLLPYTWRLLPGDRLALQVRESAGGWRLAFSRNAPAGALAMPQTVAAGEEVP